jgi:hypothetical protein
LGSFCAAGISALSCVVAAKLWNLPIGGVETAAYLITLVSIAVIILRPDCNIVGQIFYASYAAAGFTFLAFAALVAFAAAHSIAESITSSIIIALDLGAFLIWNSNINYVSDVLCRTRHSRPPPVADPLYQPFVSLHIPAYNKAPALLIATIYTDYPHF